MHTYTHKHDGQEKVYVRLNLLAIRPLECTLPYEGSVKTASIRASAKLLTFSNVCSEIIDNLYSFFCLPAFSASLI